MKVGEIAQVVHEANRAIQVIQADPTIPVGPHWEDLDNETRQSAVDGVHKVAFEGLDPRGSHSNWLRFKEEHGWKYGPVKDEIKKEHPLMVPYDELPESQRVKDELFVAIVNVLKFA